MIVFVWSKYACCSRVLCTVVGVHMRPYLQWACAIALPDDIENVTINGPFVGKKVTWNHTEQIVSTCKRREFESSLVG